MFIESAIAILIFSFVPLVIKVTSANPITIGIARLVMTLIPLGIWWKSKISFKLFRQRSSWRLWLIGLVFFFHWIGYTYGVKTGGAAMGVLGLSTYGMQLMLFGGLFLGHKFTRKNIASLIASTIGVMLIIPVWSFNDLTTKGLCYAILSGTCFATLAMLHRKFQNFYNLETRIFAQYLGALAAFSFYFQSSAWGFLNQKDWIALLALGLIGTLVAHSLWAKVTATVHTSISGLSYYAISPLAVIWAHLFLNEQLQMKQIAGAVLILLSALFNFWSGRIKS